MSQETIVKGGRSLTTLSYYFFFLVSSCSLCFYCLPHIVFLPFLSTSKGTVSVLLNHGMVVQLSDHIKGLVPRTHLSDIILKNPEKKYTEGMKVKCRVSPVLCFR